MNSGVYLIVNKINGKVYVGSSIDLLKRFREHKYDLNLKHHPNCYLQYAWNKHGEENFFFTIFEECEVNQLLIQEQYWMDYHKSADSEFGYNILKFAGSTLGRKHKQEAKDKISKAHKGNKYQLDMIHSAERRAKNATSQKGKILSTEHKQAIATGSHQILKTHCPKNHEYSVENTYIYNNKRFCRECSRNKSRKAYIKQ